MGTGSTKNQEIEDRNNWQEIETRINGLYCWQHTEGIKTSFDTVALELIAAYTPQGNDLNQFDFEFINRILRDIEIYFIQAIEAIKKEIQKEDNSLLLKPGEETKYLALTVKEFPVYEPKIDFYPGKEWLIHFQDSDFPRAEAGVLVFFNNTEVTIVDGTYDSDELIEEDI